MDFVLVTGATGFIGQILCQHLREKGVKVRVLSRQELKGPWDELFVGDLIDKLPDNLLTNIDTVFHLAGKAHALSEINHDDEYNLVNVAGTRKLLKACQANAVKRFILFSSIKAMGEGGELCLDESSGIPPETPYGCSKLEAEKLVLNGGYVPHPVALRLSMVYGLTAKGNLPKMIQAISRGKFPPLPELKNRRSMIHVDDVVLAAIKVTERTESIRKTYILTDGRDYSTRQIYEWICVALGRGVPSWFIPVFILRLIALVGDGIGILRNKRFVIDSDSLEKLIGSACYSSKLIELELGFKARKNLFQSLEEIVVALGLK